MSRKKIKQKAAKRAAKGGKAHHTPNGKRNDSESYDYISPAMPKFSLKDEARWASSHRSSAFESGKKLRSNPVSFVSAGMLEGTIPPRETALSQPAEATSSEDDSPEAYTSSSSQDNTRAMAHMAIRSPSPAPSATSSSSDEVVFRGRNPPVKVQSEATNVKAETKPVPAVQPTATKVGATTEEQADSDAEDVIQDQFAARRGGKPAWEGKVTEWESRSKPGIGWLPVKDRPDMGEFLRGEENSRDSAMDDYMQNVEDFGLTEDMMAASSFARREMDLDAGSHNDWESDSGSQEEEDGEIGDEIEDLNVAAEDSWDSDMLEDFAELSTSAEATEMVVRILSTRTRPAGIQYLCVYEGSMIDDARWLPDSSLSGAAHKKLIREFKEAAEARQRATSSESDSDEDGEDDVESDEDEDEDDDLDGLGDEDLDDEQIARVLQKQEELGLGSDEILLYAGDPYFEDAYLDFKPSRGGAGRSKQKGKRSRHHQDPSFPSATAMADALAMDPYGGFDIMDTERPSLKMKKKGRRGQMPPELEDPDLNEQMQKTWEVDRAKKRLKKAEREELRKQGLLGRKGKSANLKVKYKGGIVMEDVVEEIRELIIGDQQTLSLPPMDASRRAVVHQVASSFKLTSKSRGDGLERFTVLSKTHHTRILNDEEFDRIINSKGFQMRMRGPLQNQRKLASASFRSGGKRVKPQVGYQDGDTVGANAPELGPENRGHALLSKMGWSKGMALGSIDNQGILQPIPHTVKINKAGLR